MSQIEVVTYHSKYGPAFVELNEEWIRSYFEVESTDRFQLNNPEDVILKQGGEIFFVLENEEPVGTCAMVPHGDTFELAKMAVSPKCKGKGYGDLLMSAAIEWSRNKGLKQINLLSNTVLGPAINLYKKHGFEVVHLGAHPDYKRCNIEMVLKL
ncbi:MAG: GNAT family N-acetyltransferase [Pseudobdellovibrionaceae bacterium]